MQATFSIQRLILNLLEEDDHAFIQLLVNSNGWLEFIGDRNVHSTEDAIRYIRKIKNTPDYFYWVVRLKENNVSIGIISLLKRNYLDHFDIGFAFLPEFNGHGYAYEAAAIILSSVSKAGYAPILATTLPQNLSSIKLLTRLGFHFKNEILVENETLHIYSNE